MLEQLYPYMLEHKLALCARILIQGIVYIVGKGHEFCTVMSKAYQSVISRVALFVDYLHKRYCTPKKV